MEIKARLRPERGLRRGEGGRGGTADLPAGRQARWLHNLCHTIHTS
ncbi:MAG: hypothetical protein WAP23_01320 [Candidatus Spechtbacterales bacterium]